MSSKDVRKSFKHASSPASSLHGSRKSTITGRERSISTNSDNGYSHAGSLMRMKEESIREQALQEDTKHAALDKDYKRGLMNAFGPNSSVIFSSFEGVREQQRLLAANFWQLENDFSKQRHPLSSEQSMMHRRVSLFQNFGTETAGKELRRSLADMQDSLYSLADQISTAQAPLFPFRDRNTPVMENTTEEEPLPRTAYNPPTSLFADDSIDKEAEPTLLEARERVRKQHQSERSTSNPTNAIIDQESAQKKQQLNPQSQTPDQPRKHELKRQPPATTVPEKRKGAISPRPQEPTTPQTTSSSKIDHLKPATTAQRTPVQPPRLENTSPHANNNNQNGIVLLEQVKELFESSPARTPRNTQPTKPDPLFKQTVNDQHNNKINNNDGGSGSKSKTNTNGSKEKVDRAKKFAVEEDKNDDEDVWESSVHALEKLVMDVDTTTV